MSEQQIKRDEFNHLMNEIAQQLQLLTQQELKGESWVNSYIDVRGPANGGGSRVDKLRIELSERSLVKSASVSMEISMLYLEAWKLLPQAFDRKWYGFKLTVFPDGSHEISFNYDPNCWEDPEFYDW